MQKDLLKDLLKDLPEVIALFKEYEQDTIQEKKLKIKDEQRKDQPLDIKTGCVRMQIEKQCCAASFCIEDPMFQKINLVFYPHGRRSKSAQLKVNPSSLEPFYMWIIQRHLAAYVLFVGDLVMTDLWPGHSDVCIVTKSE